MFTLYLNITDSQLVYVQTLRKMILMTFKLLNLNFYKLYVENNLSRNKEKTAYIRPLRPTIQKFFAPDHPYMCVYEEQMG